ncbi:putative holin, partial [Cronobacter sakazakii]
THRVDHPIADGYETPFMLSTIRRAVIVAAVVLAVALGL